MGIGLIVIVASLSGVGVLSHTTCVEQKEIGTELYWTPYALVNAPYGGWTTYSANFTLYDLFGVDHVSLSGLVADGNISAGYFQTENWTIFSQSNSTTLGPGANQPCRFALGASQSPTNFSVGIGGAILQGPGNMSNVDQPSEYSLGEPNRSVVFANGFHLANQAPISTCGGAGKTFNFASSSFNVALSIAGLDGPVTAVASVTSSEAFTYEFPPNAGTWQIDNLSAPGGPGGGWAFSYSPCS